MMQNRVPEICKAQISHLDGIMEIEGASFSDPWSRAFFLNLINDANIYCAVCMEQGEILGYYVLFSILDEGEIFNIAVSPKCRSYGVGALMLKHCIAHGQTKTLSKVHLEVRAGNIAAIRMYKRAGFNPKGIRRGYYTHPKEDAIIMTYNYEET